MEPINVPTPHFRIVLAKSECMPGSEKDKKDSGDPIEQRCLHVKLQKSPR